MGVYNTRAVASLTVPGGQEFHFPHFFPKFWSFFLIFPQTFLIFFLILALQVGDSPTREGPGYTTVQHFRNLWLVTVMHVMSLNALELTSTACVLAASTWASWYWSIGKAEFILERKHFFITLSHTYFLFLSSWASNW